MKFGEFLIRENIVTEDVVRNALDSQKYVRVRLGRLLKNLGILNQIELDDALTRFFSLETKRDVNSVLKLLSDEVEVTKFRDFGKDYGVLVLDKTPISVTVLATHYRDEFAWTAAERFNLVTTFFRTTPEILEHCFSVAFGEESGGTAKIRVARRKTDDQKISEVDPFTSLFRDCLSEARRRNASDIHIEPLADGVQIRFRIMGDLMLWRKLDAEHKDGFIRTAKQLSNLSIAVSGREQDARISFDSWKLDIRVNCMPVLHGEKICLRLLDLTRAFDLNSFGFCHETRTALRTVLQEENGVVIVSGPTGSGKTSTLYSLINELDRKKKNIATVEHPVEFTFPGVNQTNITEKISLESALRALLRQDPDVILVGEIRDKETAQICFQAAATGHLVFSSLHTNGAAENVGRLRDLGIDEATIRENLRFAFSQKLRKKLCPECSIEIDGKGFRKANPQGCKSCDHGYVGRVPVVEYMDRHDIATYFDKRQPSYGKSFDDAMRERAKAGEIEFTDGIKALESNKC